MPPEVKGFMFPLLCAIVGAMLGRLAGQRRRTAIALGSLAATILGVALFALVAVEERKTFQTYLVLVLSLAPPAVIPFAAAWLASRNPLFRWQWVLASCVAGLAALAAWPVYAIMLGCYILHDCP